MSRPAPTDVAPSVLTVSHLHVTFTTPQGPVDAVRDVSFSVPQGQVTGLVGESGSGKTTVARVILGLQRSTRGEVFWKETELTALDAKQWRPWRKRLQIVFQDPYRSLNPSLSVEEILAEPLHLHFPALSRAERRARIDELLTRVGLGGIDVRRLPAHFSGGQRQRIGIARALAVEPEFLVLDEPVSALDVSVQAQILNLLHDLQRDLGLTALFISHDLAVVEHLCRSIVVMEQGQVVEAGDLEAVYAAPQHPYTQRLLAAAPQL